MIAPSSAASAGLFHAVDELRRRPRCGSRGVWRDVLARLEADIRYHNVKDAVAASRGRAYGDALLRCWTALRSLTPRRARR